MGNPLGEIQVDAELAAAIAAERKDLISLSTSAHDGEHSIEVQLPFIQALCPRARIVPVATPPLLAACDIGAAIASAVSKCPARVMVVASTDLTHYGMDYGSPDHGPLRTAMGWMRDNDRRILRLVETLRAGDG